MSFYLPRKAIRKLPGVVIRKVPMPNPEVIHGHMARKQVGEICKKLGYQSVLIVTDQVIHSLGYAQCIQDSLDEAGIRWTLFYDINSEPTVEIESKGRQAALDADAECIIALGGGSVMDSSKIIVAGMRFPKIGISHLEQKFLVVPHKTLPLITIPTTAGTGAETTVGAVTTDVEKHKKISSVVIGLNIPYVILDSELTVHSPRKITTACGIDALSHGIEGCLADIHVSEEDQEKSLTCVKLVFDNLPEVLENPENEDARAAMALAAFYGGNAINKQLAGYVHAFAHSIGARYHIAHGAAIALCIVPVIRFHKSVCPDKIARMGRYCGFADATCSDEEAVEQFLENLVSLIRKCEFGFQPGMIPKEDYHDLVKMIDSDSINYSPPKTLTDKEILHLLDVINATDIQE